MGLDLDRCFLLHIRISNYAPHGSSQGYPNIMETKGPMKVKIFIWLMLADRILTQEVLTYRGCTMQAGCQLCASLTIEIRDHIMWDCSYMIRFWQCICGHYNISPVGGANLLRTWSEDSNLSH